MSASGRIVITAVGASSALGRGARRLALGYRAGASVTEVVPFEGKRLTLAMAAGPLETATLADRLVKLAAPALAEALLGAAPDAPPLPLILAVPDTPHGGPPELALSPPLLLSRLVSAASVKIDVSRSVTVASEYEAGALVLAKAFDVLGGERGLDRVIVGAVDSWLLPARIRAAIDKGRVRGLDAPRDKAGEIVPGEGAAFLVLERERAARKENRRPLAVLGPTEVSRIVDPQQRVSTIAALLAKLLGAKEAVWLLSEVNGETRRADEWAEAIRIARDASGPMRLSTEIEHASVARELGDAGAATTLLEAVIGALYLAANEKSGVPVAVAAASAERVAGFLLEAVEGSDAELAVAAPAVVGSALSSVSRDALLVYRVLEGAIARFREVEHRIPINRRAPILDSAVRLGVALASLEDNIEADASLASTEEVKSSADALTGAVTKAARSAERRGRDPEPAALALEKLGREIAELCGALRDEIVKVEGIAMAPPDPKTAAIPLLFSHGAPSLLALPFRPWPRPPELPASSAMDLLEDELEEESSMGDEPVPPAPTDASTEDRADESGTAIECLDSIGHLWAVRTPRPEGKWSTGLVELDERLLAQLDRLFAIAEPFATRDVAPLLAGVAIDVVPLLRRRESTNDVGRAFADTLVLACCADARLVRAAVAKARSAAPGLRAAFTDALALGSSAHVEGTVAELCFETDEPTIALALEVLRRRRSAQIGPVVPHLFHGAWEIREAAARALAVSPFRDGATKSLEGRLATEAHPRVRAAVIEGLVLLHARHAEEHVARAFTELASLGPRVSEDHRAARLTYARLGAAMGRSHDVVALSSFAQTPDEIECIGWFGRVTVVSRLIEIMDGPGRGDTSVRNAAARSLMRILGLVPEATPRGRRLTQGNLSVIDDDRLEVDERIWRSHWEANGSSFSASTKYRFGRRHDSKESLAEHIGDGVRARDRIMTSLEIALGAQTGFVMPDEAAWVGSQIAAARLARVK